MRITPFMKRKKGVQFAGIGLDTGGGSSLPIASTTTIGGVMIGEGVNIDETGKISVDSGGGITFTDEETQVGTFAGVTLYCKKVSIADSFFTSVSSIDIPNSVNLNVIFALSGCQGSAGYIQYAPCAIRIYVQLNVCSLMRFGSSISSSEFVTNSGFAYIFYTKRG